VIHSTRIQSLNRHGPADGRYVLYWMQASQRAEGNHALEYAVRQANQRKLPVVVGFGVMDDYPDANERHYAFMLEGLAETAATLARRGIGFVLRRGHPLEVAAQLATQAALVVCDVGYLRHQRQWRRTLARRLDRRCVQVETDAVVPVRVVSRKLEYAARTIRPKHQHHWQDYLVPLETTTPARDATDLKLSAETVGDGEALLGELTIDRSVGRTTFYRGGASRGRGLLGVFIRDHLNDYAERRNDPSLGIESHMSPYLHFGQLSPLQIALAVRDADGVAQPNKDAYLEQLLIRRELDLNFVTFNDRYDRFGGLPAWARDTLRQHQGDERPYVYRKGDLIAARTHDPYWNAAMREMTLTGKMHNYMRMYWGKKILEWTRSPATAYRWALELNNRYFLDGRDPASFANVAWLFGQHDRPWTQREVFGLVRYMNAAGLERKFDIDGYVRTIDALADRAEPDG
jgi:deoxyribodipyrimidine photo-lyase